MGHGVTAMTDSLNLYRAGRDAATLDVDSPNFDVDVAITSFDYDPPNTPFQRGYLRGLLKCGDATVTSRWEGTLL
mgnify:CR=1 FL=1